MKHSHRRWSRRKKGGFYLGYCRFNSTGTALKFYREISNVTFTILENAHSTTLSLGLSQPWFHEYGIGNFVNDYQSAVKYA
jgi:hypothetical protein